MGCDPFVEIWRASLEAEHLTSNMDGLMEPWSYSSPTIWGNAYSGVEMVKSWLKNWSAHVDEGRLPPPCPMRDTWQEAVIQCNIATPTDVDAAVRAADAENTRTRARRHRPVLMPDHTPTAHAGLWIQRHPQLVDLADELELWAPRLGLRNSRKAAPDKDSACAWWTPRVTHYSAEENLAKAIPRAELLGPPPTTAWPDINELLQEIDERLRELYGPRDYIGLPTWELAARRPNRGALAQKVVTQELRRIVDEFTSGHNLRIHAAAGTGKTTVLEHLASLKPDAKILYLVFNREAAADARRRFPTNVTCTTIHAFAYQQLAQDPQERRILDRLDGPLPPWADDLDHGRAGIDWSTSQRGPDDVLGWTLEEPEKDHFHEFDCETQRYRTADEMPGMYPSKVGLLDVALAVHARWARSGDPVPGPEHLPRGELTDSRVALSKYWDVLARVVQRIHQDRASPAGEMPIEHDHYLKRFAMKAKESHWNYDIVMLDEAQDASPLMVQLVQGQARHGAQIVAVGDPAQMLYEWRGAVNALERLDGVELPLTRTYRFGRRIATEANMFLTRLDSPLRVEGNPEINSTVGTSANYWFSMHRPEPERPYDAYLSLTNDAALAEARELVEDGHTVNLLGLAEPLSNTVESVKTWKSGGSVSDGVLARFTSLRHATENMYATYGMQNYAPILKFIQKNGIKEAIKLAERLRPEGAADTTVGTVHQAKGMEWGSVYLSGFPSKPTEVEPWLLRVAYVGVTRAKYHLNASEGWAFDPFGIQCLMRSVKSLVPLLVDIDAWRRAHESCVRRSASAKSEVLRQEAMKDADESRGQLMAELEALGCRLKETAMAVTVGGVTYPVDLDISVNTGGESSITLRFSKDLKQAIKAERRRYGAAAIAMHRTLSDLDELQRNWSQFQLSL